MKIVRIVFGLIGITWLIGVMAFGAGTSWLMHDPDAAAGVALGAMAVDGNAGVVENAKGFAGGYTAGREFSSTLRDAQTRNELREACAAQEDSDWGAPAECDAIAQDDAETYRHIKDGW